MPPQPPHPIEELIHQALPGARLTGEPSPTGKGMFNEGWHVATTHGDLLVKINQDPRAADEHFAHAADASHHLRRHGLAVPAVLAHGTTAHPRPGTTPEPRPRAYLIQEWLPGRDLEEHLADATDAEARRAFHAFGALVAALHNVPYARGADQAGAHDTRVLTRKRLATLTQANRACAILPEQELADIGRTVTRLLELHHTPVPARMTHHDLHLPNVLVRPDGSVALIDLDFLRPGDPLEDFVKLDLWAFEHPGHRDAFRAGYDAGRDQPWPPDAQLRLDVHRILNSLSYVAFFSTHDPQRIPEWTQRLRDLCTTARARTTTPPTGEAP